MSSDEHKNKADAYVTCRDGKIRYFTADDGEVFHYKGRKYTYLLWDETEGRGLITMFVGIGIFFLGYVALGSFFKGIGLLVGAIGLGTLLAGYLYPNTSEELTNAVEEFEKR